MCICDIWVYTTPALDVLPVYDNVDIRIRIHQIEMKTSKIVVYTQISINWTVVKVNRESSRDIYVHL